MPVIVFVPVVVFVVGGVLVVGGAVIVGGVSLVVVFRVRVVQRGTREAQQQEQYAGGDEQGAQALLDVAQTEVAEQGGVQQPQAGQDEQEDLYMALHSSAPPITPLATTATAVVAVEKRSAKARPNVPV